MINLRLSSNTVNDVKYIGGPFITTASGILDQTQVTTNYVFDQILKSENLAEAVDYRCVYLVNDYVANKTIYNPKIKIISQAAVADFSIGVLTKNTTAEALTDENTLPASVTFYTKAQIDNDFEGYLPLADTLLATEYVGIWFQRAAVNVGGSGTVIGDIVFEISYDA
jgi:hypothetical protein